MAQIIDPTVQQAIKEAAGNVQVNTLIFPYQSFLDDTQLGQAIAVQSPSDPIVASTKTTISSAGFGLGLHPDSQCPVAVQFKASAAIQAAQPMILTPGQIVFPHGCAPFSGFDVGLPFGWLGGGLAQLVTIKSPEAAVWWAPGAEVVIQRQRVTLQPDGAAPTFSYGLPTGFPWKNAQRYVSAGVSVPQGGQAIVAVSPTRTVLRLRVTTLAADARCVMVIKNGQAFDTGTGSLNPAVAPTLSGEKTAISFTFPAIVGAAAYFPSVSFDLPGVLLAGDDAQFYLMNESGNAALDNAKVDVIRYGLI